MEQNEKLNFLAQSIKNARKVMEKVENGSVSPTKSNQGRTPITEDDVDRLLDVDETQLLPERQMTPRQNNTMRNLSKSKMPEAILKSFQQNPIIDPTVPIGMENMMNEISKKVGVDKPIQTTNKTNLNENNTTTSTGNIDIKLVEYIIKKTVEETIEQINKKSSLDENIQIKIGEKTFGGKITTLKEIKK
jgi:hypothetical protein